MTDAKSLGRQVAQDPCPKLILITKLLNPKSPKPEPVGQDLASFASDFEIKLQAEGGMDRQVRLCHGPADSFALDLLVQQHCDDTNNQNLRFVGRGRLIERPSSVLL